MASRYQTEAATLPFLWQPRLSQELWTSIKADLIEAVRRLHALGESRQQLCALVAFISLEQPTWISVDELRELLRHMNSHGRAEVARVVSQTVEGAAERGATTWNEVIGPYLDAVWPKDRVIVEPTSGLYLARAAIASQTAFPAAVQQILPFVAPTDHVSVAAEQLLSAGHAEAFPETALARLNRIVSREYPWPDPRLRQALDRIARSNAALVTTPEYRDLDDYLRRFGS